MRKSKKPIKTTNPSAQDREFERLYHTIPGYQPTETGRRRSSSVVPELPPERPRWRTWLKRTLITLLVIALLAGGWLGWKFVSNGVKIFGWSGLKDLFSHTRLKGEDQGRVNILLAGNSADDPGHGGAELTDSIMLVSINTKDNKGFMLSIPRDLYVNIPGYNYAKINEAYPDGKNGNFSDAQFPSGGMGLLEKTVSQYFGVNINYYALVDYTALKQAVDAVGGIQITITSPDPRGLYDPSPDLQNNRQPLVKLPNGTVTLNGKQALNLARARGDSYGSYGYGQSDFMRTENQRKILIGIKDKATSLGTLSNPIKLGQLFDSMGNNVQTDLKAGEARRLYDLSKKIPSNLIMSASLNSANGKNLLGSYTTRYGQSALIPAAGIDDFSAIQAYVNQLETTN